MSENIEIKTSLTAHDAASPIIKGLLANVRNLERTVKSFNASVGNLGRSGAASMATFSRATDAVTARMSGFVASNRSASQSIARDFKRANDQRLNDARRMYGQLEGLERGYQRQIERRVAAERRADRHAASRSGGVGGSRLSAPRIRTIAIGAAIAGGGVAGAFRERMKTQAAETKAAMFGDLSSAEIKKLRSDFADKAGIRYGVGVTKAIETAVEGLKAGINRENAGAFGDLALKAQTGLDIDSAATAKLMGRITTLKGGFNQKYLSSVLNAVAVANNATAADGNEIVEALRRSLSATVATKMSMQDLSAFDASAISIGIQPNKAGTFMGYLTSELANAKNARGQRGKDLSEAANKLGFGGRAGLSAQMIANPTQTLLTIFERLMKMPEGVRAKVASLIGQREWRDELMSLASARDLIAKTLGEIASKPGFLDSAALQKIKSLNGRWASITAAMGLVLEKIGAGFEPAFDSISDTLIDMAGRFSFDTLRDHFASFVDGLREGFGLKDWSEAVTSIAGMFDAGTIAKWRDFGKGFAEGLRDFVAIIKGAFTGLNSILGSGDAESMGKIVAGIGGLTVALALFAPVIGVLASFGSILTGIALVAGGAATGITALFIALSVGLKLSLSWVTDRIFDAFKGIVDPIVAVIKSIATKTWDWVKGLFGFGGSSSGQGGGASGSWEPSATDFSGSRKRVAALTASPVASIMPNVSGVTGGGLSRSKFESTFAGTAMAGKYDQVVAAAKANNVPPDLLAAVVAHETGRGRNIRANNVAGVMDSETGFRTKKGYATLDDGITAAGRVVGSNYRKAGGDIDKMGARYAPVGAANDPNGLNKNWAGGVRSFRNSMSDGPAGILAQNPVDVASKYIGKNEYRDRAELSSFVHHDVAGRVNAWCARFVNESLRQSGIAGTGSAVANSFQLYGKGISPADAKRGDIIVEPHGRGPNQPGGHVGFATGETRMKNGRLQLKMLGGNQGDSVSEKWVDAGSAMVRRSIQNVPSPAEAVASVPQSNGAATRALLERNGSALLGGGGGPVAININGNSHDPEALATLVQRRIEESRNWATHDNASDSYV